jgi:lipid-binding SYLF domain-containing protein
MKMMTNVNRKRIIVAACSLAFAAIGASAQEKSSTSKSDAGTPASTRTSRDEARDASQHLDKAVKVLRQMESDTKLKQAMHEAKGVFIIPSYGQAALGVGGEGGPGVLFVRQGTTWSDRPAFYTTGGISVGLQAGAQGGAVAFVLNNDKALNSFKQDNKFSLSADAGLTVVNWSKMAEGAAGKGDVTAWSDTKGLFGGVAVALNDVRFDKKETGAYYQKTVAANDVIGGKVTNPHSTQLKQALAESSTGTASGSSGTSGVTSGSSGTDSSSGKAKSKK